MKWKSVRSILSLKLTENGTLSIEIRTMTKAERSIKTKTDVEIKLKKTWSHTLLWNMKPICYRELDWDKDKKFLLFK